MKTTKNILFLLLVLVLGFTSCSKDEKDEPTPPPVVDTNVYKTVLSTSTLTTSEKATITNLTLDGNITAADFYIMRDSMPNLKVIDISGATIRNYNDGTTSYNAAEIPVNAFKGMKSLTTIKLMRNTASYKKLNLINSYAFSGCENLTEIYTNSDFPPNLGTSTNVFDDVKKDNCTVYLTVINNFPFYGQWDGFIKGIQK